MRSDMWGKAQGRAFGRVSDRFGEVLTASTTVLCAEAMIGVVALTVWTRTQESPGMGYNAMGVVFLLVVAPFAAAFGAALCALLSLVVVMPLLAVAGWLGRQVSGREAWWWVPASATAVSTLPAAVVASGVAQAGPAGTLLAFLGAEIVGAVVVAAPALVARRLLLPDRPHLSGGAMFGRVCLFGGLAVVASCAIGGLTLLAGIGYEPPRLSGERIAGTWSDGKGGALTFTEDGTVTARGVATFDFDGEAQACTGTGTWSFDPGAGPWDQEVHVSVDDCPSDLGPWEVLGTAEHPKLFVYIGDPDAWDLYVLERGDPGQSRTARPAGGV
ncbi:hypothetical protein AB0M10_27565 [Streptomyces sp. NPDC051840]|uniref:hypothetical protein n=1 Tax=unclassified Streptomyces TaxID=2593676 RepID=UPI003427B529